MSSIERPDVYFFGSLFTLRLLERPALIRGRHLFSHVQILCALVLHLTRIALAHMASLGKRLHCHQTGRPRWQVHTTCTRASATWILRPCLTDQAFNRGLTFISRTSMLTPVVNCILTHVLLCSNFYKLNENS